MTGLEAGVHDVAVNLQLPGGEFLVGRVQVELPAQGTIETHVRLEIER